MIFKANNALNGFGWFSRFLATKNGLQKWLINSFAKVNIDFCYLTWAAPNRWHRFFVICGKENGCTSVVLTGSLGPVPWLRRCDRSPAAFFLAMMMLAINWFLICASGHCVKLSSGRCSFFCFSEISHKTNFWLGWNCCFAWIEMHAQLQVGNERFISDTRFARGLKGLKIVFRWVQCLCGYAPIALRERGVVRICIKSCTTHPFLIRDYAW